MDIRGWALQIADNHIGRTQKNGGFIGNNAMHTPVFKIMAHPTIKQDVASKKNREGVARKTIPHPALRRCAPLTAPYSRFALKGGRICGKGRCCYGC